MQTSRRLRAIVCALMPILLAACAGASPAPPARSEFCLIYEPVYAAPADTEATRRQIDRNNAAWAALCEG